FARRAITMIPALIVIGVGFDPSKALILSQVFLSFGIPFALVPLLFFTSSRKLMAELVNRRLVVVAAGVVTALIIGLNVYMLASAGTRPSRDPSRNLLLRVRFRFAPAA